MATVYKPEKMRAEFSPEEIKTLKKACSILQDMEAEVESMGMELDSDDIDWINFPHAEEVLSPYDTIGELIANTLQNLDDLKDCIEGVK